MEAETHGPLQDMCLWNLYSPLVRGCMCAAPGRTWPHLAAQEGIASLGHCTRLPSWIGRLGPRGPTTLAYRCTYIPPDVVVLHGSEDEGARVA